MGAFWSVSRGSVIAREAYDKLDLFVPRITAYCGTLASPSNSRPGAA